MNETKTDKSELAQYEFWKKRVRIAREKHRQKVWDWFHKVIKEYSGESKYNEDTGEKYEIIAQTVMAIEETIQPHLMFQNPEFYAKAKQNKSTWEKREELSAQLVNYEYKDIKHSGHGIELENELVILDARLLPFGCTKTGYAVEGDILREPVEQNAAEKAIDLITGKEKRFNETPVITKERGQVTERKNPLFIYLDFTAEHITKQKFIVERMLVSQNDLKSVRYDQKLVAKMEPSASLIPDKIMRDDKMMKDLLEDPDFKGFEIFEIHDLEHRVIHTIANGVEGFLEKDAPYPVPEGSQYSFCWFLEEPNEVYPLPPLKFYRKRASEYSYIYSEVSKQIDKFVPKIGVDVNALDAPEKVKFKNGIMGTLVSFNRPPAGAWATIQPTVQADLFKYLAMTKELLYMEAGVPDFEVGVDDDKDRPATETALIAKGSKGRRSKPQKRVKGFLRDQAHKIWQILKKNAPYEHFAKVLGELEAEEWWNDPETGKVQWTDENLAADYWFDYDIESVTPDGAAERNQKDLAMLEIIKDPAIGQNLAMEDEPKKLQLSPILNRLLKNNIRMRDTSEVIVNLKVLSPDQEHSLWMQGQYPPISEDEMKNPQKLMEHYESHVQYINSPGFMSLPPEMQEPGIAHTESYIPLIQKLQAKQSGSGAGQSSKKSAPSTANPAPEPLPERMAAV